MVLRWCCVCCVRWACGLRDSKRAAVLFGVSRRERARSCIIGVANLLFQLCRTGVLVLRAKQNVVRLVRLHRSTLKELCMVR